MVANPARGLLNRKREQNKKSGSIPPPPTPHTARSEKINKITRRIYRRYASLGRSRVRTRIPSACRLGQWVWLRKFYTPVCDNKFPSIVASLFSWRGLVASTSSFLHAAMNLRPSSVAVSTHTSAFKAVAFQSPAMPNARMSLWTQSVRSFSFPPVLSVLHPQGFQKRFALAAARRSFGGASPPTKVFSFATSSQCSHTRLSQGHDCTKSSDGLVSCAVPR